jgi:hypothetical protein
MVYVGTALIGEPIGLAENADGWTASYGPIVLCQRSPPQAETSPLWICGQRKRVAHKPTASATTADLNKTRNVLPMSPV